MARHNNANAGGRRGEIKRLALMVCTYKRPDSLPRFIDSVARLNIPAGIELHLCVADNNPESQRDAYIGASLSTLSIAHSYGHEPDAGYSNARNKALELALDTQPDLLAFGDDDMELDPNWLTGHLRSYAEFDCDVVGGAIRGRTGKHEHGRRFAHGEVCDKQGAGNVSFRSWLVASDGLALRFDPRFNKTGREDQAFFSEAHARGARIVFSKYPVITDPSMAGDNWRDELMNKAEVSALMHRNDIVRLRKETGFATAFAAALWSGRFALKFLVSQLDAAASRLFGRMRRADLKAISAHKNIRKAAEGFKGLSGDYVARGDARRK